MFGAGDKLEQRMEVSPLLLEVLYVDSAPVADNTAAGPVAARGSTGLLGHVDSTASFVAGSLHNNSLEQQTRQDIHSGGHQAVPARDSMASPANICRRHALQVDVPIFPKTMTGFLPCQYCMIALSLYLFAMLITASWSRNCSNLGVAKFGLEVSNGMPGY